MGTTLTGTTPQDTYDSLIKVTDNGPLSGTLKALSDGLGNDSALALSTGAASITGTLAVSGNAAFDTNTLFVDAASNEVGIGTASPQSIFHIGAPALANAGAKSYTGLANTEEGFLFDYYYDTSASNLRLFDIVPLGAATTGIGGSALRFLTVPQDTTGTPLERLRITSAGNVGIGTSNPTAKLYVQQSISGATSAPLLRIGNAGGGYTARMVLTDETTNDANIIYQGGFSPADQYIGFGLGASYDDVRITGNGYVRLKSGTNGIQFNGDTAAANALDDYEEGTWTPQISNGTTNVAVSSSYSNYTKIGRQVVVNTRIVNADLSSFSAGDNISFIGLPFTSGGDYYSTVYARGAVAGNLVRWISATNATTRATTDLLVSELVDDATDYWFTLTYFV